MELPLQDRKDLQFAKNLLENPGLAARLTHVIGTPVEKVIENLPAGWSDKAEPAIARALGEALRVAAKSMSFHHRYGKGNGFHKALAAVAGGAGGAFGIPALLVELPISTTIMLRSILDVAQKEGEATDSPETQLAALEVFALGGPSQKDDAVESGYFAVRAALASSISKAAKHIAAHGVADQGAPALIRLIAKISTRFGVQVSQKAAAQTLPVLGAIGGATINWIFMDHFQDMARGHFVVRRLERIYGADRVREEYDRLDITRNPDEEPESQSRT